jgi:hypothetical protein
MNNKILVVLALTLSACGGATPSIDTGPYVPANPYADLADGVHILSFTCTNSHTMELSNSPATRTLRGIVGAADRGFYGNPSVATCQLKVASIKNFAGRAYDVIVTSGTPGTVAAGHVWPYSTFPLCVGSTDLSSTASCVSAGTPQTDANGVATINIGIDNTHTWNGKISLRSSLKLSEDGGSYAGTNQEFAIISGMNGLWVNNNGSTCNVTGFGSCSSGVYPGFTNLIAPADFNCQALSGYGQEFRNMTSEPICQPL